MAYGLSEDSDSNNENLFSFSTKKSLVSTVSTSISASLSSADFLREWSLRNNLTHNSITELLAWFQTKPDITGLPLCARTLRNNRVQTLKNVFF